MLNVWNSAGSTDFGADLNWSLGTSPTGSDNIIFNDTSDVDCVLDTSRDCGSLNVAANYNGNIDLTNSGYNLTVNSGDVSLNGGGEFVCGNSTLIVESGSFDRTNQSTFSYDTSTLRMNGVGSIKGLYLYNLEIGEGASITGLSNITTYGTSSVSGNLKMSSTYSLNVYSLRFGSAGRLTGTSASLNISPRSGEGVLSFSDGGLVKVLRTNVISPLTGSIIQGYYSTSFKIYNTSGLDCNVRLDDITFSGNLELENTNAGGSLTINNSVYNPVINSYGNIVWDEQNGSINWIKGNGRLNAVGSGNQTWDFDDSSVECIVISKS